MFVTDWNPDSAALHPGYKLLKGVFIEPNKPAHAYRIGDRAGIFKLLELHEHEAILGETDKHLDVKITVARQDKRGCMAISVSTVVHVHNAIGRLYMLFVTPAHRIIAPATVSKLAPQAPGK